MSNEWTSANSAVTALMAEPLSKRAQLLSPSIWTQAMFSGLLHWLSGLGFKKGTFQDIFKLLKPHLGTPVEQLLVSEGSSLPSLLSPLFHLNSLFWQCCWNPLDNLSRWSGLPHLKQFWSFFWYSLTNLAKWMICSPNFTWGFLVSLFSLLALHMTLFSSNVFHYGWSSHEGMIALQLPRGKQVLQCLWLGNI